MLEHLSWWLMSPDPVGAADRSAHASRYNKGFGGDPVSAAHFTANPHSPTMSTTPPASRPPMLSTADALATLLTAARRVDGVETVDTFDALGRVLATAVVSPLDVPPMRTSSMDGYAVRAADLGAATEARSVTLPVSQRVPAGQTAEPLAAGTVARIFTGATVPPGADAIVMQEVVRLDDTGATFTQVPPEGEWITQQGADIRRGSVILPAGTRLTPQALGLAASVGSAALEVVRKVRVAVFFTGDELTMPGEPLRPGAIYNSNRFTLCALLAKLGCDVTDLLHNPTTRAPMIFYLLHIVSQLLDGRRLVCWMDEFSSLLSNPAFERFAANGPRTWRKLNGVMCLATQSPREVIDTLKPALLQTNCNIRATCHGDRTPSPPAAAVGVGRGSC